MRKKIELNTKEHKKDSKQVDFNELPKEMLLLIYLCLSLKDIDSVSLVSKFSRQQVVINDWLWISKFQQHFPYLFNNLSHKNKVDWYAEFRRARHDYLVSKGFFNFFNNRTFIKRNIKLFPLVKEGDLQGLKDAGLQLKDLKRSDKKGITLLEWAKQKKYGHLLDYFFELAVLNYSRKDTKIAPTKKDKKGRTILHWAILCHRKRDIVEQLILDGCHVDATDELNKATLHYAAQEGQEELISFFIAHNVNIDARDIVGSTPLLLAVENGHKEVVDILLSNNANTSLELWLNIDFLDLQQEYDSHKPISIGDGPLHAAVKIGRKDIVNALLDKGAKVNSTSFKRFTPLHYAAMLGHTEIAELLIQRGANVNARSKHVGITPLLLATENGHRDVIDVLLFHNADTSLALLTDGDSHKRNVNRP